MGSAPAVAATFGLVLVGGASSRMGADKATLDFDGHRLASRSVQALLGTGIPAVATVGPFSIEQAHTCDDLWPGSGPLGGIVSGIDWALRYATHTNVQLRSIVVLACDLPFVDASAVHGLLTAAEQADAGQHGVLGNDGVRTQPLFSLLHHAAFAAVADAFEAGTRSPMQVFEQLSMSVAAAVDDGRLRDVDTPEQLKAARERALAFPEIPPKCG